MAPPLCGICGGFAQPQTILCSRCETELSRGHGVHLNLPNITAAWAARPYTGVPRQLITALKFSARLRLADRAAELIAAEAPPSILEGSLVPVPPSPRRYLWRGFDPAAEIATALARLTGMPLAPCLRRSNGRRQVGRSRAERRADPPRVRALGDAPPEAVLIDDVTTTGATLGACAAVLRAAGSADVRTIAFAATPNAW